MWVVWAGNAWAEPSFVEQQIARESKLGKPVDIAAPDGSFTARVRGTPSPVTATDGGYAVNVDLNGARAECLVLTEPKDFPSFLMSVGDGTFTYLAEQQGPITTKELHGIDAGAAGDAPYMGVNWLYGVQTPTGLAAGGAHLLYGHRRGWAVYCLKQELGYTETYRAMFQGLLASLERPSVAPTPIAVDVMSAEGQRIGIWVSTRENPGTENAYELEAIHLLVGTGPDKLTGRSEAYAEWLKPGTTDLRLASRATVVDGALSSDLRLLPGDGGRWTVSGKRDGQDVGWTMPEGSPTSRAAERILVATAVRATGDGRKVTARGWDSGASEAWTDTVTTYGAKSGKYVPFEASNPKNRAKGLVRWPTGAHATVTITDLAGAHPVTIERVVDRTAD